MALRMGCMAVLGCGLLSASQLRAEITQVVAHGRAAQISLSSMDSMFTHLPLAKIDRKLMLLVTSLTYGKTPAEIISGLASFFSNTAAPLFTAVRTLIKQKNYIQAAIDIAQTLQDVTPNNSPQNVQVQQWMNELDILLACVEDVLLVLKDNPQLVAMIMKSEQLNAVFIVEE